MGVAAVQGAGNNSGRAREGVLDPDMSRELPSQDLLVVSGATKTVCKSPILRPKDESKGAQTSQAFRPSPNAIHTLEGGS